MQMDLGPSAGAVSQRGHSRGGTSVTIAFYQGESKIRGFRGSHRKQKTVTAVVLCVIMITSGHRASACLQILLIPVRTLFWGTGAEQD